MDDPVHDGIRLRSAAEPAMPFIHRILSDKDGGMIPAALFKQFIEVLGVFFGKFVIKPLIKNKEKLRTLPNPITGFTATNWAAYPITFSICRFHLTKIPP